MSLDPIKYPIYTDVSISGCGSIKEPLGLNFNNISGLQPYNEVLLFSANAATSAVTLPESRKNFERLKIRVGTHPDGTLYEEFGTETETNFNLCFPQGQGGAAYWRGVYGTWTDTKLTLTKSKRIRSPFDNDTVTGDSYTTAGVNCVWEVWGVNRK